jgi:hypothetical protein
MSQPVLTIEFRDPERRIEHAMSVTLNRMTGDERDLLVVALITHALEGVRSPRGAALTDKDVAKAMGVAL